MIFIYTRWALTILGSALAAHSDIKTGYIYDKITYPLIVIGILLNIISLNVQILFNGFLFAAIVYILGYALYYTGQMGGGDVKLFTAVSLLLPFNAKVGIPFPFLAIVIALVLSAIGSSILFIKQIIALRKQKEIKISSQKTLIAILVLVLSVAYTIFLNQIAPLPLWANATTLLILALLCTIYALSDQIKKVLSKEVSISKIEDGDVISELESNPEVLKISKSKRVIDKQLLEKLKSSGIRKVTIYSNLPKLGPYIFVAILITAYMAFFV